MFDFQKRTKGSGFFYSMVLGQGPKPKSSPKYNQKSGLPSNLFLRTDELKSVQASVPFETGLGATVLNGASEALLSSRGALHCPICNTYSDRVTRTRDVARVTLNQPTLDEDKTSIE